jgi:hypothetical protein
MTQYHVTLTEPAFQQLINGLAVAPHRIAVCPVGVSRLPDRVEWLVHEVGWRPPHGDDAGPSIGVLAVENARQLPARLHTNLAAYPGNTLIALLGLGLGPAAGSIAGICRTPQGHRSLGSVTIIGAGLPCVTFTQTSRPGAEPDAPPPPDERAIWSRTIGALGESAWQRLRKLHVGVVGCGRSGSLAAAALRRLGVHQLTLIDKDVLEPHNLGEMDGVTLSDVGRAKVHAVADTLRSRFAGTTSSVIAVPDSILSLSALVAVKQTDVLFCCVDNAGARLSAALLAALYLKPLLDIGTGIFHETGVQRRNHGGRRMGADIRLILPGRCLLCLGGIAHFDRARAELLAEPAPSSASTSNPRNWQQERAGSLLSLNGVAVHLALRLLEDLVSGRIAESVWLHLEINEAGIPTLEQRHPPANPVCRLCALAAHGDDGARQLRRILEER